MLRPSAKLEMCHQNSKHTVQLTFVDAEAIKK
jgi:hypothetical protein